MVITLAELYNNVKTKFAEAGFENPSFEALSLISHFLNADRVTLSTNPKKEVVADDVLKAVNERLNGRPLQYILGCADFYGRDFLVGEGVLIPRFDTEILIDETKKIFKDRENLKILDLCSGSGIIAITLEKELKCAQIYALEKSKDALKYLNLNKEKHNCNTEIIEADVKEYFKNLDDGFFDLIISNPPYITADEMKTLPKDVKNEPHMALFGGDDGLSFYRTITQNYKSKLKKNGYLIFEIGYKQSADVTSILKENDFKNIRTVKDLQSNDRAIIGTAVL
jgi:release factor glutamine methyltransferase